jgi:hypothetical protein
VPGRPSKARSYSIAALMVLTCPLTVRTAIGERGSGPYLPERRHCHGSLWR